MARYKRIKHNYGANITYTSQEIKDNPALKRLASEPLPVKPEKRKTKRESYGGLGAEGETWKFCIYALMDNPPTNKHIRWKAILSQIFDGIPTWTKPDNPHFPIAPDEQPIRQSNWGDSNVYIHRCYSRATVYQYKYYMCTSCYIAYVEEHGKKPRIEDFTQEWQDAIKAENTRWKFASRQENILRLQDKILRLSDLQQAFDEGYFVVTEQLNDGLPYTPDDERTKLGEVGQALISKGSIMMSNGAVMFDDGQYHSNQSRDYSHYGSKHSKPKRPEGYADSDGWHYS